MGNNIENRTTTKSFGVENHYSSASLFALLTRDHKSWSGPLQNNWKKIAEDGYDPIYDIRTIVTCDIKAKNDPNVDRFAKSFYLESKIVPVARFLGTPNPEYEENPTAIQFALHKQGIDVFLTEKERQVPGLPDWLNSLQGLSSPHFVSKPGDLQSIDITMSSGNWTLLEPSPNADLANPEEFASALEEHFKNIEKIIRVIYQLEGKDLPPVKLQFRPESENPQEFFAECSYCGNSYFITESLVCPGCSASKPRFVSKAE